MAMTSHLSNVWFSVTPLQVASGKGCWVTTTDGEEYLDFAAGIAVNSTGHAHPHVAKAIAEQAQRFIHAQVNVYKHDLLEPLAAKLSRAGAGAIDTFFFANSGAEITEAAIKLAKQVTKRPQHHRVQRQLPRPHAHGDGDDHVEDRLSRRALRRCRPVCSSRRSPIRWPPTRTPRSPTRSTGFDHLLKSMTAPDETAAVILEPVLGEGGYIPAPQAFMTGLVERCRAARDHVHRRRGAERLRSHRQDVRGRALRHRARHHLHGQGHRQRASRSPRSALAASSTTSGRPAATAAPTAATRWVARRRWRRSR